MTMQHTPGLWLVELNPTIPEGAQIAAYSDDGNRVLQVIVRSFNDGADMRLIAAAPELLEALQYLLDMPDYDGTAVTSGKRKRAKRLSKAAIAKAKGEA